MNRAGGIVSAAAPSGLAIDASGLTRRFGTLDAVDHISLQVRRGVIHGLLGSNGAGKSTTIKMLTTLLSPTSGSAIVGGHDSVREPAQVRRRIGYVPQALSADGALTGAENLMLSARLYDVPRDSRKSRVREALRFMGLEDSADRLVKNYSGGMIRRLELAQAMLHRPEILFLDEPTIGLDPVARRTVWQRLREMKQALGMTVLITTHDMEEADELCDVIAIMHAGRLVIEGSPAELKASVGVHATMEDVFSHYCGGAIKEGGNFADTGAMRRVASRLG